MKPILLITAVIAFASTAYTQTDSTTTSNATATTTTAACKRAQFCSAVTEREPADDLSTLAAPADKVYFFTELVGMAGKTVTHKWSHDGTAMGDVAISVGADRWRCYSTKTLAAGMTGTWTVTVVDDAGTTLVEKSITYTAAP